MTRCSGCRYDETQLAGESPHPPFGHLLPLRCARGRRQILIIAFSPFASSQMGEGARRADEGFWPRVENLPQPQSPQNLFHTHCHLFHNLCQLGIRRIIRRSQDHYVTIHAVSIAAHRVADKSVLQSLLADMQC